MPRGSGGLVWNYDQSGCQAWPCGSAAPRGRRGNHGAARVPGRSGHGRHACRVRRGRGGARRRRAAGHRFWTGLSDLQRAFGPRIAAALATRNDLHGRIDARRRAWHGRPQDDAADRAMRHEIGYLVPGSGWLAACAAGPRSAGACGRCPSGCPRCWRTRSRIRGPVQAAPGCPRRRQRDRAACWPVMRSWLGGARPAGAMPAAGLQHPRMKIEIEVTARQPDAVAARAQTPLPCPVIGRVRWQGRPAGRNG